MKWYEGQNHYRIASVREKDAPIEAASISRTQMRELLGVTKNTVTSILESRKYNDCLEIVQVGDTKRVTKTSFIRFLCMQDKYRLIEDPPPGGILPTYLSLEEAAKAAGISRQAVSGYAAAGCFPQIKTKGIVRIPRSDFQKWLKSRLTGQFTIHAPQEGEHGIDQKTRKNIQRHLQLPGRPGQEKAEMGNLQDQRGGHAPQEGDRI